MDEKKLNQRALRFANEEDTSLQDRVVLLYVLIIVLVAFLIALYC